MSIPVSLLTAMSSPTWELVAKPALIALGFTLAAGLIFYALAGARRRDRRLRAQTRGGGVVVAGVACLAMAGAIGFQALFFAITG